MSDTIELNFLQNFWGRPSQSRTMQQEKIIRATGLKAN